MSTEPNPKYVWINNELVPEKQAALPVNDLAIQRGYGIFDFLKVINGRPIFIDDHLNRFYRSAAEMYMGVELDKPALKAAVNRLMDENNLPDSAIKIILTGGYAADGYTMSKPNLVITQVPFKMEAQDGVKGLRLVTVNHQRQVPSVKTIDYLQAIRLRPWMIRQNADDLLYHNNGFICECPRANFFIVTADEIITAADNILWGIVRSKVLHLHIENYRVAARNFTLDELAMAKEAFITSSTKNAYPVVSVDNKPVGNGQPGPVTSQINKALEQLMFAEASL